MAVQAVDRITKEIDMEISETVFYTDSKVVLGYITTPGTEQAILSPNDPELKKELKPLRTSVKSSGSPALLGDL